MIALDTNVLIYCCDKSDSRRQQVAFDLVARAVDGVLLWQVACEFVAASRKLSAQAFTASNAWSRLAEFIGVLRLVLPTETVLSGPRSCTSRTASRSGMP
jgi:predicted nucleic acid-binding protein